MSIALSDSARDARLQGILDLIETGSGDAALVVYTSPRPATGGTPTGATTIATAAIPYPCGSVTNHELLLSLPTEVVVSNTGNPYWARLLNRDGGFVGDMSVGLTGSGADVEISAPTVYQGGILATLSAKITE